MKVNSFFTTPTCERLPFRHLTDWQDFTPAVFDFNLINLSFVGLATNHRFIDLTMISSPTLSF